MPDTQLYLRPAALVAGASAEALTAAGQAGWLAGRFLAFTKAEVIERRNGRIKRRWCGWPELAASRETALRDYLAALGASRPAVMGLALETPVLMGIVNVTADSFFDGGSFLKPRAAIAQAEALSRAGAGIIDIGGESTRPGAQPMSLAGEAERVLPVIAALTEKGLRVSVDTRKSALMRQAAARGAGMINDVSALGYDGDSLRTAAELELPVCLMHAQGEPQTMQDDPRYDDVALDVFDWLRRRVALCVEAGIPKERLIIDPGIGFGKTVAHNLALMAQLTMFHGLGVPVMLGASRKSFIGAVTEELSPGGRLAGSLGAALAGAAQGVQFLRVHDVAETRQALALWRAAAG